MANYDCAAVSEHFLCIAQPEKKPNRKNEWEGFGKNWKRTNYQLKKKAIINENKKRCIAYGDNDIEIALV